jgi:soluble lytic murein transglycosylase
MNKLILIGCGFLFNTVIFAHSAEQYLNKFLTYTEWSSHLPNYPDPAFLNFIDKPTPLTRKLREKWLYQLAHNKDWSTFNQYYRGSNDTTLQCYAQVARYHQGMQQSAIFAAKELWMHHGALPHACDPLFTTLLKEHDIDDHLIQQRIALALEDGNLSLARFLLKQYSPPKLHDIEQLNDIHDHPTHIKNLNPGFLHSELYLYGLMRLIPKQLDKAIALSETSFARHIMTQRHQQLFLVQVAQLKAMRDEPDTAMWFAKVKPEFYTETLLEWQIRYALIHHHWRKVIYFISKTQNKRDPMHQYWMARALEALHEQETSRALYQELASKRNYYGFLASLRLHKKPNFEHETTVTNTNILTPYKPVTDKIKALYLSHQIVNASRLLNDFVSELPKDEQSALAYWVANELHWHGQSIYLSTNDALTNQLVLRFPLAHRKAVETYASSYQIPQELIYAIIRQESSFHDDIVSPVGANGLMQVMPATARAVAKRANITYHDPKQLLTSEKNIHIGTAYLQQLAKSFHNHPILMAAAYNAGPRQANYWLKNHKPTDIDIWIETLPWRETRNYIKNILAFYAVYQYRMQEKPNLDSFMQPF